VSVVRGPPWALLSVLLLAVLGAAVLEPNRDPGLLQLELERDRLAHEHVRIVARLEHTLLEMTLKRAEMAMEKEKELTVKEKFGD
jgi:hypothetical protein